jgi:DNA-binding NarL/FixJ family response regulator
VIRLVIATDIRLYREGLTQLLGRVAGLSIVGMASDLEDTLKSVRDLRPDVVLIDLATPESHTTVRAVRVIQPDLKIVALTVPEREEEVIACIEAGVVGYVTREAGIADLVAAVQSVGRGEFLCSPRVAALLRERLATLVASQGTPEGEAHLTTRELDILKFLESGLSNKEIARQLGIEVATVKNHVHNILDKLHVHRRGEAAARMRGERRRLTARDDESHSKAGDQRI